jgi:hypothetical protein
MLNDLTERQTDSSGTGLGQVWDSSGTGPGQVWDCSGRVLGQAWDRSGTGLGQVWDSSRTGLGQVWDSSGTRKRENPHLRLPVVSHGISGSLTKKVIHKKN